MTPRYTAHDALDRVLAYSVVLCELTQRRRGGVPSASGNIPCSDLADLLIGQTTVPILASTHWDGVHYGPALRPTVPYVVFLRPSEQMVRADAITDVAGVANLFLSTEWSDEPRKDPDVRALGNAFCPETTVPVFVHPSGVQPTSIGFLHLRPEAGQRIDRRSLDAEIHASWHVEHPTTIGSSK